MNDLKFKIAEPEKLLVANKEQQAKQLKVTMTGKEKICEKTDGSVRSETTIYRPAVELITEGNDRHGVNLDLNTLQLQNNSSSDKGINTSDEVVNTSAELMEIEADEVRSVNDNALFLDNLSRSLAESRVMALNRSYSRPDADRQIPSTSAGVRQNQLANQKQRFGGNNKMVPSAPQQPRYQPNPQNRRANYFTPEEEKAHRLIREAEQAKIQMFDVQGKTNEIIRQEATSTVDDNYLLVAAHMDEGLQCRIACGEYIDFVKLLPKDRIISEGENNRLQIVNRDGQTYFVPASREGNINSFGKWEQTFRVFANVYLHWNPGRATELIEYNHVIHAASQNFAWDNVYVYDRDFRLNMSQHPGRNWGIILQQAWAMHLNLRYRSSGEHPGRLERGDRSRQSFGRDLFGKYNKGKCTYGSKCKFEHKCGICGKYGHGAHLCRRGSESQGENRENSHRGDHAFKANGNKDKK